MVGKDSFAATIMSLLQEKFKTVFVSRAQRKKEADDYAAVCVEAWRIARDTAAELRELAAQCRQALEGGGFAYDSAKVAAIRSTIAALKSKDCPPELKLTISDLEAMIAWSTLAEQKMSAAAVGTADRTAVAAEAEEKRSHAEQVEAQLVVNARLASAEADKFVGW